MATQAPATQAMSRRQSATAYIDFLSSIWFKRNQHLVMHNTERSKWPSHFIQLRGMIEILGLLHSARQDVQSTIDVKTPETLELWRHRIRVVRRQTDAELLALTNLDLDRPKHKFGLSLTIPQLEDTAQTDVETTSGDILITTHQIEDDPLSAAAIEQRALAAADRMLNMILDDLSPRPYAERVRTAWASFGSLPLDPIIHAKDRQQLQDQAEDCRRKIQELRSEHDTKVGRLRPSETDKIADIRTQFEHAAGAQVKYMTARLQNMVHEIIQRSEPLSG